MEHRAGTSSTARETRGRSMRDRMLACCLAGCVGSVLTLHAQVPPTRSAPPRPWDTLRVSVAPADLAAAAGLPSTPAPEDLLPDVFRVLLHSPLPSHESGPVAAVRDLLQQADSRERGANAPSSYALPSPLARDTWRALLAATSTSDDSLLAAIVDDRRSALLWVGTVTLDAATREAIEKDTGLLSTIHSRYAGPFAAFARSVRVRDGAVVPPGPAVAQPAWLALAGAVSLAPESFVPALLAKDRGRLAYFYDAVSRLDTPHLRWVFGRELDAAAAHERLGALYEHFRTFAPEWNAERYPFYRAPVDAARLLQSVAVDDGGHPRGSASLSFWMRVFGNHGAQVATASPPNALETRADPGWMLARLLESGAKHAGRRLAQVQFAQRLLQADVAAAPRIDETGAASAAAALERLPALMRALGRLEVRHPATIIAAARLAEDVTSRAGRPEGETALVMLQSVLAILEATHASGSLDSDVAARLVRSLSGVRSASSGYGPVLADWVGLTLMPALATATGHRPDGSVEDIVLHAMAGARVRQQAESRLRTITWQAERFVLDPAGAALDRLRQLHAEQPPSTFPALLAGPDTPHMLRLTAAALRDLAYLPHLGDPQGPIRLAPDLPRRHVLLRSGIDRLESAWSVPRELVTPAEGWHVEGAIVGLDVGLARLGLRRIEVDLIPPEPHLDPELRRRFVLHAALGATQEPTDDDARAIAGAWARGRDRSDRLRDRPGELEVVAERLGLEPRRVEALRWALARGADAPGGDGHGTRGASDRFSAGELVRLGLDAPAADFRFVTLPGENCPEIAAPCDNQLTDLDVRLIVGLVEANLPASLLRPLRRPATQDFVDQVQPAHVDDHGALRTWVRALPASRLDDYVTSLEGRGPLRAEGAADAKEQRR